jgi:hypothetical protein
VVARNGTEPRVAFGFGPVIDHRPPHLGERLFGGVLGFGAVSQDRGTQLHDVVVAVAVQGAEDGVALCKVLARVERCGSVVAASATVHRGALVQSRDVRPTAT